MILIDAASLKRPIAYQQLDRRKSEEIFIFDLAGLAESRKRFKYFCNTGNNLVPKGTAWVNGGHVADRQIKVWKIVRNVRLYDDGSMRVEGRLRARFDLDGATDIRIALGRRSGIPEK